MLTTMQIPEYRVIGKSEAGDFRVRDHSARQVPISFPGLPPVGLKVVAMGQDYDGTWCKGMLEVTSVEVDPGWRIPSNETSLDNQEGGYMNVTVRTRWEKTPGARVYRG